MKKDKITMRWIKRLALLGLSPLFFGLAGCALSGGSDSTTANPTPTPTPTPSTTTFVQVERLGRPAVNEGLIASNSNLNLWNSIPPTLDLDPSAAAVALRAEAINTIDLANPSDNTTATNIALAFLPDVMRVDTGLTMNVSDTAYSFSLVNLGSNVRPTPVSGRKLEDDVVDITLSVLTDGAVTTDNVSFSTQSSNPSLGHNTLSGQNDYREAATFPFLAAPR